MSRWKILELFESNSEYWHSRIDEGIDANRKGNARIRVCDEGGNPVKNAVIDVNQKNHSFRFGTNIFMLDEMESEAKNEAYKKHIAEVFNMATLPFYWADLEPQRNVTRYEKSSPKIYRRPSPDLCLEFCEQNGIEPREHALAYEHFFPLWLKDADVDEIKRELERRYREISERYADKIRTIEVTNEMEWNEGVTKFYNENDYVEWCFKLAQKYFPKNQLCINEHTWLCWEDKCRSTDKYYSYIEANMLRGARIDAIGMQYHLFIRSENEYAWTRRLLCPDNLYRHMDLYASLGKPLQITEVTVPSYSWNEEDEEIQARVLEWLYSIWFSHKSVEQIIYWNLVDGYAYCPDTDIEKIRATQGNMTIGENYYYGGLFRFDMTPKKAFLRLKELINEVWHTSLQITTDEGGYASFRGFFGDYELCAHHGDARCAHSFTLLPGNEDTIQITL